MIAHNPRGLGFKGGGEEHVCVVEAEFKEVRRWGRGRPATSFAYQYFSMTSSLVADASSFKRLKKLVIAAVCAKCRLLWNCLVNISQLDFPFLVGGDFNIVRHSNERLGGNSIDFSAADEFNNCIATCGLLEFSFSGSQFTWKNSGERMRQRLHRYLCNNAWMAQFGMLMCHTRIESGLIMLLRLDFFKMKRHIEVVLNSNLCG